MFGRYGSSKGGDIEQASSHYFFHDFNRTRLKADRPKSFGQAVVGFDGLGYWDNFGGLP